MFIRPLTCYCGDFDVICRGTYFLYCIIHCEFYDSSFDLLYDNRLISAAYCNIQYLKDKLGLYRLADKSTY